MSDPHGLTIAVYRVNPVTGERTTVKESTRVPADDHPIMTGVFPPCECPKCEPKNRLEGPRR
jgi:hypothetical protein